MQYQLYIDVHLERFFFFNMRVVVSWVKISCVVQVVSTVLV
jgi:hypothetical protein